MPLYVYALVASPRRSLGKGAFDEPLRAIRGGGLAAITGKIRKAPKPAEESLRAHDQVVRRLFEMHDPLLPARFGTTFEDDSDVAKMLDDRASSLAATLERVTGGTQMTLRIFSDEPLTAEMPSSRGGPGTRFLAKRRAAAAPPTALAPLLKRLSPFVLENRVERHDAPPLRASIHQLVARDRAEEYLRVLERSALPPGITIHRAGPFPPYAFAETA